ncbi:MAG: hypothetical protein Q8935_10090 [Bacillota bacterium]|nr:hypothetical protein [Bacillota bacterium]
MTECTCLTNEKYEELQQEYDRVKNNEYKQSYIIESQKKRIEDIGRTLKLYEAENKALRELIRLWV